MNVEYSLASNFNSDRVEGINRVHIVLDDGRVIYTDGKTLEIRPALPHMETQLKLKLR